MRTKHLFIILFLAVVSTLQAQQHLPESKSLVGMWRLVGVTRNQLGETVTLKTGNYKVINPDGTFYVFITWGTRAQNPQNDITSINLYGTYTITSDSTYTEHIVKIDGNPEMNNSDSEMKYKFAPDSDNNVVYLMWKNSALNRWVPEMWERVVFPRKNRETQDFEAKGVYYTIISDNEVAVTKGEKGYSGVVNIPQQVTHSSVSYTVSEIGKEAFSSCTALKEVALPNSIRKIHDKAFLSCFSLRNYRIPDSTEYIGNSAFSGCASPDTVFIPEKVAHIGAEAFSGNKSLKWIEVAHFNRYFSSENGVLFNNNKTEIIAFPAAKKGHYDIPPTITAIGNGIFSGALNLTSVNIPYSVIEIGKRAFWYCSALESVGIAPSVIIIDEQAFAFCSSLKKIAIPASVRHIGNEAFFECKSLKNIDIPSSISVVNERTFAYCTSLEQVNIKSATVRAIDKLAFSYCTSLKELTLPSTVTYIGHGAFYPCKELSTIRVHHVKPLALNGYVFSDVDKNKCKVFVPASSIEEYKKANEWKEFRNFVPTSYRFAVSFSQPKNGALELLADSAAIQSGSEFAQSTEFTLSLSCQEGYEFEQFIINGITFDFLPPSFKLMDDTKIEVKLKRSEKQTHRVIELAQRDFQS